MKNLSSVFACCVLFYATAAAQLTVKQDPVTGLKGMVNSRTGIAVLPFEFDDIRPTYWLDSVIVVHKDGWKGAYDPSGKLTVPVKYRDIRAYGINNGYAKGFVMLTSEAPGNRHFGLYRLGHGFVLPEKFETVAPVFPDLLVGREYRDTVLQFFSIEGKPLFTLPGMAVKSTVAGSVMEIEKRNNESWFVGKTGKPVVPENIKQPRWTDGRYVICGKDGNANLLTVLGDTVLKNTYHRIQALDPDRFIVYTDNRTAGMVDGHGSFLIPIEHQSLFSAYPDIHSVIISRSGDSFDRVYSRGGKILLSGFRYERYHADRSLLGTVSDQNAEYYFWARMVENKKTGMYHWTGRQIVPPEYRFIYYGSENHVLIAQTYPQEPGNKEYYAAYNLQGKLVLPPEYNFLRYTRDPNLLIGKHASGEKFGFVPVDKPGKARFEYDTIINLYADHYAGPLPSGFVLLNPKGKRVNTDVYATLSHPQSKHVLAYDEKIKSSMLVAVGTRKGDAPGVWYGVNDRGEATAFPPFKEEPVELVQGETAVEAVVEAPKPPDVKQATGQGSAPGFETIFERGDTHPAFTGGEAALKKYIDENLQYPVLAKENGIQGRVVLTFTVETDGSLSNPQIIKDIGAGCGKEALRLVAAMPKWQPGTTGGKPVRAKFTLPVEFKLK